MNAIKNKFRKSKRNSMKLDDQREDFAEGASPSIPSQDSIDATFSETASPVPPPMPPSDFYHKGSPADYAAYFLESHENYAQFARSVEVLPTQVIEKPAVIHNEIREERVEEIQPVVQVDREKTEIRQIIQPLIDREVKAVRIEERVLPTEVLPTIQKATMSVVEPVQENTTVIESPLRKVVEKAPIIEETEKWRVIEEIQPIIYRETIVPHVIRVNRPMREVIVEQPIFAETVLQRREMYAWEREKYSRFLNMSVPRTDLAGKEILIRTNEGTTVLPVAGPMNRSSMLQETRTTTTVTEQIPIQSSNLSMSSEPIVIQKSHKEGMGTHGEKIVQDTVTTQMPSVLPTKAN